MRKMTAHTRSVLLEKLSHCHEEIAVLMAQVDALHSEADRMRVETKETRAELEKRVEELREANENLVLAHVKAQAVTEVLEDAKLQMSHLANHDFLTNLPNRMLLQDRLVQAASLASRRNKKLALLYIDLDHFKHINDSLGHLIGDEVLRSVAQRLSDCVRDSDTVSRHGGDEFIVLLTEIEHEEDAFLSANKILLSLAQPHNVSGHSLSITGSIGISIFPDNGTDAETLGKCADIAMYHAKQQGRDNIQLFNPQMNTRAVERKLLETGLRNALINHEFVLYYQPKVNLETGAIIGAEALIRWHHPERGLVYPAEFIPVAEESGLIVQIGHWVLQEACQQMRVWHDRGLPLKQISVNISALQFRAPDFLDNVRTVLAETGLASGMLELELTESVVMQDAEVSIMDLQAIKNLGVGLALDDFGTGYSSLAYLRRFPLDVLKIDQSFVHDLDAHPDETSIISAVMEMGKSLGLRVIAEGIETRLQHDFLRRLGCTEAQGYFFYHPLDVNTFADSFLTQVHL